MAGSDDRFANLAKSMKKKELINNALYKTPHARIKNQNKIEMPSSHHFLFFIALCFTVTSILPEVWRRSSKTFSTPSL